MCNFNRSFVPGAPEAVPGPLTKLRENRRGQFCAIRVDKKVRGAGANAYASSKDRRANKIIEEKGLNIGFKAITFGTYGAFGTATHRLIAAATANTPCPVYSPWVRPSPKQRAYLLFGVAVGLVSLSAK